MMYRAKDMASLAAMFDRMKAEAEARLKAATKLREQFVLRREVYCWGEAARIISQTKIGETD